MWRDQMGSLHMLFHGFGHGWGGAEFAGHAVSEDDGVRKLIAYLRGTIAVSLNEKGQD